jgi:hypothetical protein
MCHECRDISTVVAREFNSIGFTLIFWPFGRGYEPRLDKMTPRANLIIFVILRRSLI